MEDQWNSEAGRGETTRYNIYQLTITTLLVTTQYTVGWLIFEDITCGCPNGKLHSTSKCYCYFKGDNNITWQLAMYIVKEH